MPQIKTASDIKNLVNDADNIKVMTSLFQAIAYYETVRAVIEPKKQAIVDFYKFQKSQEWIDREAGRAGEESNLINSPDRMYLAADEDFNLYLKELEEFYYSDACPFKPERKGNCPLLEAESLVRDVKVQVADYFKPYFGFGYNQISGSLSSYKKYYDLLLSMFAHKIQIETN